MHLRRPGDGLILTPSPRAPLSAEECGGELPALATSMPDVSLTSPVHVYPVAHGASIESRDRMAQRHPRRRQDDDQCARAAPDPGFTGVRRREGRRDTHGHHAGAARDGQLPALAAVAAARRRDRPPRTRLHRRHPGDAHDRPGRAVLARDQHGPRPTCHPGKALRPPRRPGHPPRAHRGGTPPSPPRSASNTSSPTPRRPARGYTARPRSSTPRTSRPPRPPCRSPSYQEGPDV